MGPAEKVLAERIREYETANSEAAGKPAAAEDEAPSRQPAESAAAPAKPKGLSEIDDAAPEPCSEDLDAPREYDDDDLVLHDDEAASLDKKPPKLRTVRNSSEY